MGAEWITSPTGRRVLTHWADRRAAWLWSADGRTLVWHNPSARLFGARIKKGHLKLLDEAEPIKGQVSRLIRLGSAGRTSLARLHFLAGSKPVSETCAVTPLALPDGQPGLLVVTVEPVDAEIAAGHWVTDALSESLFAEGTPYLVTDEHGRVVDGTDAALDRIAPALAPDAALGDAPTVDAGGRSLAVSRFRASPEGARLMLFGWPGITAATAAGSTETAEAMEPADGLSPGGRSLTALFDRLVQDRNLYTPLGAQDDPLARDERDHGVESPAGSRAARDGSGTQQQPEPPPLGPAEQTSASAPTTEPEAPAPALYRVIGRSLTPFPQPGASETISDAKISDELGPSPERGSVAPAEASETEPASEAIEPAPDAESVERVSRYNFDELGRILADRIGLDISPDERVVSISGRGAGTVNIVAPQAALVNLTGETFVLNRLPLGILVFRDQQVLFANRALLDLLEYETVEALREAGLAALFPDAGIASAEAGPVTRLISHKGRVVAVNARLQSISWQGRPALLLSASAADAHLGHEIAVRAFAELLAEAREEGFIIADPSGTVTFLSGRGKAMLPDAGIELVGRPLAALVDRNALESLRGFLDRPARFAETARPSVLLDGVAGASELLLFAEGQAGIVTGYFGFVRRRRGGAAVPPPAHDDKADPTLLARLSRGIRRPLNTVVGFSDIIASEAFGPIQNTRYAEYARDIRSAGHEIAALVDELDDYARLRDGSYSPRPSDIDLTGLLESCVVRVREQARQARVLVRSAISETLPRISADRASLGQAILNLMASAIDQTPVGGSVVLSAQREEDGSISIHVRDSAGRHVDLSERFVVFRDGAARAPVRSTVGLALTRSLLAVNDCSLTVDPAGNSGMLITLVIPADLVVR